MTQTNAASQTILAIVPARSGSKGFPGKNLAMLGDKPLVMWPYDVLTEAKEKLKGSDISLVRFLSTDSKEIADLWPDNKPVTFRPKELARDGSTAEEVIKYELGRWEFGIIDAVLWFQPTSPLVNAQDILEMIKALSPYPLKAAKVPVADRIAYGIPENYFGYCEGPNPCRAVIAVTPAVHPLQWGLYRHEDGTLENPLHEVGTGRRQEQPPAYYPIGVFLATVDYIKEHGTATVPGLTKSVVVPRERAVDIDTEEDLIVAEAYLKKQQQKFQRGQS